MAQGEATLSRKFVDAEREHVSDDDKTWAEIGSYPESKTSLSLYRSLFVKNYVKRGFETHQLQK